MFLFPVIPALGWIATMLGIGTLAWYYNLSDGEKRRADAMAEEIAVDLFGVAVDKLTESQAHVVHARVRQHFNN